MKSEELINNYEDYLVKVQMLYEAFIQNNESIKIPSKQNIMALLGKENRRLEVSDSFNSDRYYDVYNSTPISLFYRENIKENDESLEKGEKSRQSNMSMLQLSERIVKQLQQQIIINQGINNTSIDNYEIKNIEVLNNKQLLINYKIKSAQDIHSSMLKNMLLTKKVHKAIQIYEQNLNVGERESQRLEKNSIVNKKIGISDKILFENLKNKPISLTQNQINQLEVKEGKMVLVIPKLNFEKRSETEMMILVPPAYSNQPTYSQNSNRLLDGGGKNQTNYNASMNKVPTDYVVDFKANKASKTQNEAKSINEQMKTNVQKLKQTVNYDIGQLERGQMTKLVDTVYKQIEERLIRERRRSGL